MAPTERFQLNFIPYRLIAFLLVSTACIQLSEVGQAAEIQVAQSGNDRNPGTLAAPFRTIQHAADLAQPGDVITVHAGVYRERVIPPRGGESDAKRITYRAAPGEKVTITGSEIVKNWKQVANDTWKVTIPNSYFGDYNPYGELIHGDWFTPGDHPTHTGAVYLNGDWLIESGDLDTVLKPAGDKPLWFGKADGGDTGQYLINVASFTVGGQRVAASTFAAKNGEVHAAPCSEGSDCIGYIRAGNWLKFDKVNFKAGTDSIDFRAASVTGGGDIEIRLDDARGALLGRCEVADTGDWQRWATFTAKIKPVSGERSICLVFRPYHTTGDNTTIWAQFPGVDPNNAGVEINVRKTVFTPEKTGINYLTLRGFVLRNAATNWAPPTAGQFGLVTAYWNKGWIIENNEICYSRCCGIALGKYSDEWDGLRGTTEGYYLTVDDAFKKGGWSKENIGSHLVRNNRIHHCEQTGIVGSLGCSFSKVIGNEIHDIHVQGLFSGAEMAGIKFHGAIDVVISGNHIYRCGEVGGIWLDWMAQGAQVTGNLMHDNVIRGACDIFLEMQHGPILVANNLLLSQGRACAMDSQGIAFVHNLILGPVETSRGDTRVTPYLVAHSTETAGMYPAAKGDSGDDRFYNNIFLAPCNLGALNNTPLPSYAAGNVFTKGSAPANFDTYPVIDAQFDPQMTLTQKSDGWYLEITLKKVWGQKTESKLVTTELLGKASVPDMAFENGDGSPIRIATDYFGNKRDEGNPFPGPFELAQGGTQIIKVWPRSPQAAGPGTPPSETKNNLNAPAWPSATAVDGPFEPSKTLAGIRFTGRHAEYQSADTWYPSWASDGKMYSPWTDGSVNGLASNSAGANATTGYATIIGDDPLKLQVVDQGIYHSDPAPYQSRYPCGSLMYNGVWYYGTYSLGGGQFTPHDGITYNWPWLGAFVGFRYSSDFGKTWTQTPCTPGKPLFGETGLHGEPVKIGAPHFVDFGRNMEHSLDGKAYLVAHGSSDGLNRRFGFNSWITGDEIYLLRVTPGIANMNDASKYEFFDGAGWTRDFAKIKPIAAWRDKMGCVTMTYDAPLKKYLMCVTDGETTGGCFNSYILESSAITGPFKLVQYLHHFGEQAYFVNIPSKFIGSDGRTMWLCYSANFAPVQSDPPGSRYAMCLREMQLLTPGEQAESGSLNRFQ